MKVEEGETVMIGDTKQEKKHYSTSEKYVHSKKQAMEGLAAAAAALLQQGPTVTAAAASGSAAKSSKEKPVEILSKSFKEKTSSEKAAKRKRLEDSAQVTLQREEKRALIDRTHDALTTGKLSPNYAEEMELEKRLKKLATSGGKFSQLYSYGISNYFFYLVVQLLNAIKKYQNTHAADAKKSKK